MGGEITEDIAYQYTGQEKDEELGLLNFRARFYDAELGRFYGVDPQGQFASQLFKDCLATLLMQGDFYLYMGVGALSGAAGAGAGQLVAGAVGTVGFAGGALTGAASGFAGGFVSGTGNAWTGGASFNDGLGAGLQAGGYGAMTGGVIEGVLGGIKALNNNLTFWKGAPTSAYKAPQLNVEGLKNDFWSYVREQKLPKGTIKAGPIYEMMYLPDAALAKGNIELDYTLESFFAGGGLGRGLKGVYGAARGSSFGQKLFLSEKFGITSTRFGSSFANAQGTLNQSGRFFKAGWSSSSIRGGGMRFRIGIGSASNPNVARFHMYVPRSFVPNNFANPSIQVKNSLFRLGLKP